MTTECTLGLIIPVTVSGLLYFLSLTSMHPDSPRDFGAI